MHLENRLKSPFGTVQAPAARCFFVEKQKRMLHEKDPSLSGPPSGAFVAGLAHRLSPEGDDAMKITHTHPHFPDKGRPHRIPGRPSPRLTAPHTEREVHHAPLFLFCGKTRRRAAGPKGVGRSVFRLFAYLA